MGVFLKFCVGMNLPQFHKKVYWHILNCDPPTPHPTLLPPYNDNFISPLKATKFTVYENAIFCFVYQVKQKTLIIWGEDDQIIRNNLAVVSLCYGYKAQNATDK